MGAAQVKLLNHALPTKSPCERKLAGAFLKKANEYYPFAAA